jgi:hypothetical protein
VSNQECKLLKFASEARQHLLSGSPEFLGIPLNVFPVNAPIGQRGHKSPDNQIGMISKRAKVNDIASPCQISKCLLQRPDARGIATSIPRSRIVEMLPDNSPQCWRKLLLLRTVGVSVGVP